MQGPDDTLTKDNTAVPSPNIKNKNDWANDDIALKEDKNWESIEEVKEQNDIRWLSAYGIVLVTITYVFALIFLLALLTWAWHYLSPTSLHWLDVVQLTKIQSVLFSGGMGAIISGIVRTQIGKTQ